MKDNKYKIFQLMSSLSIVELRLVKAYLNSNKTYSKEILIVFKELENSILKKMPLPSNENLIKILNLPLTDQDIRIYKSHIVKAIENILVQQELSNSNQLYQLLLTRAYIKKEKLKYAQKEIEFSEQYLDHEDFNSSNYYLHKYMLSMESYQIHKNEQRENFDFKSTFEYLDKYYLTERLRVLTLLQNYKKILGNSFEDVALDSIHALVQSNPQFLQTPIIKVYHDLYQILHHGDNEQLFDQTFDFIKSNIQIFPSTELKDILLNLNNYCIRKINTGNQDFLEKSFNIFLLGIETSSLLDKGVLSRFTFKNIVTLGIRLQKFEWTEKFIDENYERIEKKFQDSSYAYNKAYLEYSRQNHDEAIHLLQKADGDDILIVLSAKNLLSKIYWEKNYLDPLEYLLGSTAAYLRRKKPEKIYLDNYTNIITSMRKLLQLKKLTSSQKSTLNERKQIVRNAIENLNPLTEKKWLLEQLGTIQ